MQAGHIDFPPAVSVVLPKQVTDRLTTMPGDHQAGIKQEGHSGPPQTVVELKVLVGGEPLVPAAHLVYDLEWVGAERQVVYLLNGRAEVIGRVANTEPARHGNRDSTPGGGPVDPVLATPHSSPTPLAKTLYG